MTELERARTHKDERDKMIDRATNGVALDAIMTGAEVLALICWRRQNPAWSGVLALLFFALAGKLWPMGEAYEEQAYRKAGVVCGSIGVVLFAACGRAMKRSARTENNTKGEAFYGEPLFLFVGVALYWAKKGVDSDEQRRICRDYRGDAAGVGACACAAYTVSYSR